MAFCKNCGAELSSDSAFCPKCGANTLDKASSGFGGSAGGYKANIQARNIVTCVILSIVTCGIYGLVWFFNLVSDLNTAAPSPEDKTAGTVLLLSIVTCGIYSLIWAYKAGEKVDRIRTQNGEAPSSSAVTYLVLSIFGLGIVAYCLMQTELNKVASIPAK